MALSPFYPRADDDPAFIGQHVYVDADKGADTRVGLSPDNAKRTLAAAIAITPAYGVIHLAPGTYSLTEAVIGIDNDNITIIGEGGFGAIAIEGDDDVVTLENFGNDVQLINLDIAAAGTGTALLNHGRRLRAINCKFEGGATAVHLQDGADGEPDSSDCIFDGCEFAWTDTGVQLTSGFHGGVTQLTIRKSKFHDCSAASITSNAGADHLGIEVSGCLFDGMEDGSDPTAMILLNGGSVNSGIVADCSFATALAGGLNLVDATVHWVSNRHTGGLSTGQPS